MAVRDPRRRGVQGPCLPAKVFPGSPGEAFFLFLFFFFSSCFPFFFRRSCLSYCKIEHFLSCFDRPLAEWCFGGRDMGRSREKGERASHHASEGEMATGETDREIDRETGRGRPYGCSPPSGGRNGG